MGDDIATEPEESQEEPKKESDSNEEFIDEPVGSEESGE
jgi:hypothetical protein